MADVRCVYFGTDGKPKETKNADTVVVGGGIKTSTGTLTVNGASDVILSTAGTERARILASNGDMGVGTASPGASIHAYRTSGTAYILSEQTAAAQAAYVQAYNSGASGGSVALAGYGGTHAGTSAGLSRNGLAEVQVNGNAASLVRVVPNIPLHFSTNEVVRATILGDGKVGIGVQSPTNLLEVSSADNDNIAMLVSGTGKRAAVLCQNTTGSVSANFFAFGTAFGGTSAGISRNGLASFDFTPDSAAAALIRVTNNTPLHFSTNEVVRVTILGDGKVGIGTTAPAYTLDVNSVLKVNTGSSLVGVGTAVPADTLSVKKHAAFTGSESNHHTAAVQTTDATVTTLDTFTLADTTLYWLELNVIGRDTSGTDRAFYKLAARAHREGGGATLGTINMLIEDETNAAWDCTLDTSGNDVRVRVTGAAATTINWVCKATWQAVSGNS